jgi:hypothetical protein
VNSFAVEIVETACYNEDGSRGAEWTEQHSPKGDTPPHPSFVFYFICYPKLSDRIHPIFSFVSLPLCRGRPCTYTGLEGMTLKPVPTRRCRVRALQHSAAKRLALTVNKIHWYDLLTAEIHRSKSPLRWIFVYRKVVSSCDGKAENLCR